ncbi:DUF985 domain [Pyrenophora seminiperda CCB06]|uniref:DUF985 domain n=1 Tax=Pyrenophora seminiperda CCB06 TaxID=1302712 RepID=A0A3M7M1H9_9PLEO|nr:DUF985 domain [Pyrenophora seminiperda CCB06]
MSRLLAALQFVYVCFVGGWKRDGGWVLCLLFSKVESTPSSFNATCVKSSALFREWEWAMGDSVLAGKMGANVHFLTSFNLLLLCLTIYEIIPPTQHPILPSRPIPQPTMPKPSSIPGLTTRLTPPPSTSIFVEPAPIATLLQALELEPHFEGGFYKEIDRDERVVENPFVVKEEGGGDEGGKKEVGGDRKRKRKDEEDKEGKKRERNWERNASTSIYYLLTKVNAVGCWHRNRGRTVRFIIIIFTSSIHTLIRGRARYIIIHADEPGEKKRVETFVVGHDVAKGERMMWVVEGGKYKASFLVGEEEGEGGSLRRIGGCTVVPGFELEDHDFLTMEKFKSLVTEEQAREMHWLVRDTRWDHIFEIYD